MNTPVLENHEPAAFQCTRWSTAEILSEAKALSLRDLRVSWSRIGTPDIRKICSDLVHVLIDNRRLQYPFMFDFLAGLPDSHIVASHLRHTCNPLWQNAPGRYGNPTVLQIHTSREDREGLRLPCPTETLRSPGKCSTLLVGSTTTTGKTLARAARLLEGLGFHVTGAVVVCDAGNLTAEKLGIPYFYSLISRPLLSS